uniref:(California timema) hypothetical protein n=1 Tax=Timema californicum TaxID=61474 RepID=A0A7R9P8D4_TIMCA|nr:unnamed protein product [Timema californicum]
MIGNLIEGKKGIESPNIEEEIFEFPNWDKRIGYPEAQNHVRRATSQVSPGMKMEYSPERNSVAFNNAPHSSHKATPAELMMGHELLSPINVKWQLPPEQTQPSTKQMLRKCSDAFRQLKCSHEKVDRKCNVVECLTPVKEVKIINGMDLTPGNYPSVVSVALDEGVHICGGSILTTSLVVTSAHCLEGMKDNVWRLRVRSGTVDLSAGVISNVTSIAIHEQYDPFSFWTNDIALINVATQFILDSNTTAAAVLPEPEEELPPGTNVTAVGWGLIYEDDVFPQILQNVQLKISSQDSCNEIYSALGAQINQTMMCAGVQDKRGICSENLKSKMVWNESFDGRP